MYRTHRSGLIVPQDTPLDALEAIAEAGRIIAEHNAARPQIMATLAPALPRPRRSFWPRVWDGVLRVMPAGRRDAREPYSARLVRDLARYSVPKGFIGMWAGTIADIPSGWVICNGSNGTPNLIAVFIKGVATDTTDPGATGGGAAATHSAHTGTAVAAHANHTTGTPSTTVDTPGPGSGAAGGAHTHTVSAHDAHVVTQPSAHSSHTAAAMEPAYFALCFIMRL